MVVLLKIEGKCTRFEGKLRAYFRSFTSTQKWLAIAEHAGEEHPHGMQRLLSSAMWDTDGVRDDLRSYVIEHLGSKHAVLVIDETSFPKRGKKSAGAGLQYCGTTGHVENCQLDDVAKHDAKITS